MQIIFLSVWWSSIDLVWVRKHRGWLVMMIKNDAGRDGSTPIPIIVQLAIAFLYWWCESIPFETQMESLSS